MDALSLSFFLRREKDRASSILKIPKIPSTSVYCRFENYLNVAHPEPGFKRFILFVMKSVVLINYTSPVQMFENGGKTFVRKTYVSSHNWFGGVTKQVVKRRRKLCVVIVIALYSCTTNYRTL